MTTFGILFNERIKRNNRLHMTYIRISKLEKQMQLDEIFDKNVICGTWHLFVAKGRFQDVRSIAFTTERPRRED